MSSGSVNPALERTTEAQNNKPEAQAKAIFLRLRFGLVEPGRFASFM
jgi:hypothetical protein